MAIFREFTTSSGILCLGGKSSESNESLIEQVEKDEIVLHTAKPGSPFVNVKSQNPSDKDIEEAAIFCARFSQDWRDNKKDVIVHVFKGKDIYKEKDMKEGCFGVKRLKEIKVKKIDIENFEK